MITQKAFNDSALLLGVEPEAIQTVAEVESGGDGFLPTGEPLILFEPHVFWRELKKRGIDPKTIATIQNADILYEKWGTKPYGKISAQHGRLKRAREINKDAALSSASWGKFQIMGNNFAAAGFASLDAFIFAMYGSEEDHLLAFANFNKSNPKLLKALREKDWETYALYYNGKGYKKNNYHIKLPETYQRIKSGL